ncbi:MAG TPA: hypothetical protein VM580_21320 [Labilithrix sp.]|nr:hypothetical protein [Labilithrix sp.]
MFAPSADGTFAAEDFDFVLVLGFLWLASAVHVWSAIYVCSAVANGTFGSMASLVALVVTVVLPVFGQKGLSVWEGAGPSRWEGGDALSNL